VPYPDGFEARAGDELAAQAHRVGDGLRQGGFPIEDDREIVALIAYLQRLGTDVKVQTVEAAAESLAEFAGAR
jgi:cytochrome c oxidase cbb3-type subunit I/II